MDSKNIYIDMVADLFHPGHIGFIKLIKKEYPNSNITVGLMSDLEATKYKRKPVLNINERTIMLESCKYISNVIPDAPMPITKEFIDNNKIDFVIHGDDISNEQRYHWYNIPISMGIYKEVSYTNSISTTDIIDRIKKYNATVI